MYVCNSMYAETCVRDMNQGIIDQTSHATYATCEQPTHHILSSCAHAICVCVCVYIYICESMYA